MTLPNTQLNDRVLWYDGQSAFNPNRLIDLVSKYNVKYVSSNSAAVTQYNQHVSHDEEITVKTTCNPLSTDWVIPEEYKTLDMLSYLADRHAELMRDVNDTEAYSREKRLVEELAKYTKFGLIDVLRTITWVINTLDRNHIVWGVGRGSSVSSYVLYVIGVHDVDSYAYDLDIDDFLHQ